MNLKKIHLILFLKPYYKWTAFNTTIMNAIQQIKSLAKF